MNETRLQRDVFTHLLSMAESAGVSSEQLLSQSRLNGMSNSANTIVESIDAVVLLETAAELMGDPRIGLRLGQKVGINSYDTYGFASMSCANMRDSCKLLLRYGKVFFKPHWESQYCDGGLLLWPHLTMGTPKQQRIITELAFSAWSNVGMSLYRSPLEGIEIQFTFPQPANTALYDSIFRTKIIFGAQRSQIFLPDHILDLPVKTANKSDHVLFNQQCEGMLRSFNDDERTTTEVRRLLLQSAGNFLDISQIAGHLNMSERTLRRKLKTESVSFRALFEEVRDLLATEYLTKTDLTVADIAHLLSYSETVNFRRAFVRWNGITPSDYRQRQADQVKA